MEVISLNEYFSVVNFLIMILSMVVVWVVTPSGFVGGPINMSTGHHGAKDHQKERRNI
jgi:hypothetical protein